MPAMGGKDRRMPPYPVSTPGLARRQFEDMADWSLEQLSLWVRLLLPLRTRAVDQRDTRRMRGSDVRERPGSCPDDFLGNGMPLARLRVDE